MADEQTWTKEKLKSRIDGNELDLSLCSISKVPIRGLLNFPKVTVLDLSCNKINVLPEQFTQLVSLTQLDLSKNSLSELPEDFGKLKRLRKLDLFSNNLIALPLSFHELENLQWLDLKANPIQDALPQVVGDCLQPVECKACAEKMLGYMKSLYEQKLMEVARAKQRLLAESAKQQKEDEALRLRRREEKQRRKEEYQRALPQKVDGDTYLGPEEREFQDGNALPRAGRQTTMTSCWRTLCLAVLVLLCAFLVACLAASRLFEDEWNSFVGSARVVANRLVETLSQGL